MFLEPFFKGQRNGWIEVICGSMFSGKTEELLRRLRRAQYANQTISIFKPTVDSRYSEDHVVSHDENSMSSITLTNPQEIIDLSEGVQVIGFDEAQFFGLELVEVCESLALQGKRVIVAGLDMDYLGKPFGSIPGLLAVAEYITKVHAICPHCGNLATHSYRLVEAEDQVLLGSKESYEPRCRLCYQMGPMLDFRRNLP